MPRKQEKNTWYPLDNAGVLYSAIQKERYSAVYRFSALMTKAVDPQALQRAVQKTMPRFPGFGVRIRRGAFWCYFEPNPNPGPFVKPDMANPCQPLRFHEDNDWLIRILYYEKRISVEVFHAISDGAGTLVFLRTLLAVYLRELGFSIPNGPGILDVTAPPRKEELEDAYARYAGSRTLRGKLEKTAFPNTSPGAGSGGPAAGGCKIIPSHHHRVSYRSSSPMPFGKPGGPPVSPSPACGTGHSHQSAPLVPLGNPAKLYPYHAPLH